MMEKLMVDSVVQWARQYKVDGFRFDIMGFHLKSNMSRCVPRWMRSRRRRMASTAGHLPVRRRLELRRHGQQRPRRQRDPGQHGRHRHRHVQRPHPRRGARRWALRARRDQGFVSGLYRAQWTFGGRRPTRRPRCCSSRTSCASASPATSRATRSSMPAARRSRRQVDYSACRRLRPAARGHDPVHRRARRSGLVRRQNLKLATAVPRADRVRMARLGMESSRCRRASRSSWRATRSCAPSRRTGTATTPATGSTASTGR